MPKVPSYYSRSRALPSVLIIGGVTCSSTLPNELLDQIKRLYKTFDLTIVLTGYRGWNEDLYARAKVVRMHTFSCEALPHRPFDAVLLAGPCPKYISLALQEQYPESLQTQEELELSKVQPGRGSYFRGIDPYFENSGYRVKVDRMEDLEIVSGVRSSANYVFVVAYRNQRTKIERCLRSIVHAIEKTDKICSMVVIDDDSNDRSLKHVQGLLEKIEVNHVLVRNPSRRHYCRNLYNAINLFVTDEESIIIEVDGDDYLNNKYDTIAILDEHYNSGALRTLGSFTVQGEGVGFFHKIANIGVPRDLSRLWEVEKCLHWAHLKTYKKSLFMQVPLAYFLEVDTKRWLTRADDNSVAPKMLELAGERVSYIPENLYIYDYGGAAHEYHGHEQYPYMVYKLLRCPVDIFSEKVWDQSSYYEDARRYWRGHGEWEGNYHNSVSNKTSSKAGIPQDLRVYSVVFGAGYQDRTIYSTWSFLRHNPGVKYTIFFIEDPPSPMYSKLEQEGLINIVTMKHDELHINHKSLFTSVCCSRYTQLPYLIDEDFLVHMDMDMYCLKPFDWSILHPSKINACLDHSHSQNYQMSMFKELNAYGYYLAPGKGRFYVNAGMLGWSKKRAGRAIKDFSALMEEDYIKGVVKETPCGDQDYLNAYLNDSQENLNNLHILPMTWNFGVARPNTFTNLREVCDKYGVINLHVYSCVGDKRFSLAEDFIDRYERACPDVVYHDPFIVPFNNTTSEYS